MKYTLIPLAALMFATPVFAQETPALPQKRDEIRQHIEQKKAELQPKIEEKRLEVKQKIEVKKVEKKDAISALAKPRVSQVLSQIFERFDAVLVKFDGLNLRIQNRIVKLDEQGVDTAAIKELLTIAETRVDDSTALISAAKIETFAALEGEVTRDELRAIIDACKASLKESYDALAAVIASLKAIDASGEELTIE